MEDKMGYHEFDEFFWNYIDENLVSNMDLDTNKDWADEIVFSVWRTYKNSESLTENEVCKIAENIISAYNKYKPILGVR